MSVTSVYCGQTVGWIKMKHCMEVGLGPGNIVLDGDPAPPKGAQPPICGLCLLWSNIWMDQDATWYGGRPRPRRHSVRWGHSSPKRGHSSPHTIRLIYCGKTAGCIKTPLGTEVVLGAGHIVLDGDPAPPQKGAQQPPLIGPCLLRPNRRPSQQLLSSCWAYGTSQKLNGPFVHGGLTVLYLGLELC